METDSERFAPLRPGSAMREPEWASWPDDRLLEMRFSDFDLRIPGTALATRIDQLYRELKELRFRFRPYFWVSTEWFTPDGVPGCAVPLYLVHPRLSELEPSQVGEVEGGTPEWCMRILRHETGHALDNAYLIRRRKKRQSVFGKSSTPYPESYEPRPYSRRFVQHLEPWYAQSHPDEDFAETFAVWMTPHSTWRQRYAKWPAYEKLVYMDHLMHELHRRPPMVRSRKRVEALHTLKTTLGEHYEDRKRRFANEHPTQYDTALYKLFRPGDDAPSGRPADRFIDEIHGEVVAKVSRWTGAYKYIVKQVLKEMRARCRTLGLRTRADAAETKESFVILLTAQTMRYLHKGRHREWL